jgi:retron-type reverse transcriptase
MKRHANLFQQIISFENLFLASRKARRGKRTNGNVMRFEMDVEEELFKLQEELATRTYVPGPYREFKIFERKPRKISAAPYRDRVVHHALCNIIEPIFERTFIFDSYACRKGKGTHKAVDRFTEFSRLNRYVLKMDIRKYFPSIDHEILLGKIQKKIKCRDTLWLVRVIIDGSNEQGAVRDYFPGDDLFSPLMRKKGIPIGNLTSQFFANIYLNELDHYVKEELNCRYYIRYVDDLTVFDDQKKRLWLVKDRIEDFLTKERLKLNPLKTLVAPVSMGIDHLGYRIYPTHRRIRKDNAFRFIRRLRKMGKLYRKRTISFDKLNASVQSWLGHAKQADTFGLRRCIFEKTMI